jgi:dTDP-4-dehydrorhamnose 3,5-epimerase
MSIEVKDSSIPDVKIIISNRFIDDRGFFVENYKEIDFGNIGIPKFVQDNLSESSQGVIRGLHWQAEPFGQGKLVRCLSGAILDVAVDVRPNSTTFGEYVLQELNSGEDLALWVPSGFAHGFQSLTDKTLVTYKVTNYWNIESERSLNPLDPTLSIPWPIKLPKLSKKDSQAPSWSEVNRDASNS